MPDKVCLSFYENTVDLHFRGSIPVHCHTPSWSHDHIGNNADMAFCFGCFSEGGLTELFFLEELSNWSVAGFSGESLVFCDAGSISSSLSDDSCSLSLTSGVVLRAGRRSFTWCRVPLTDKDCSLTTPVTCPFLKLEVHRLL